MSESDPLFAGYRRFRAESWPTERLRYCRLAAGQAPETLVIGCSDSRVDPQTIFGAAPGELFVVRNVAAIVPPYGPDGACHGTSAALEYAVKLLRVRRIVVLGHAECGGVRGLVEGVPADLGDFLAPWIAVARPALAAGPCTLAGPDRLAACERAVVAASLANLGTFPWVRARVAAGDLDLLGLRFGIERGDLERLGPAGWEPVPPA